MQVSKIYEFSRFYKADDVVTPVVKTIVEVLVDKIGNRQQQCLVLRFDGELRRLPLNKTNAVSCANAWGDEAVEWVGKSVELYRDRTEYDGEETHGIRLRFPAAGSATVVPATVPVPVPQPPAQAQPSAPPQSPAQAPPSAQAQRPASPQPPTQEPSQRQVPPKRLNRLQQVRANKAAKRVRAPEADYPSEA